MAGPKSNRKKKPETPSPRPRRPIAAAVVVGAVVVTVTAAAGYGLSREWGRAPAARRSVATGSVPEPCCDPAAGARLPVAGPPSAGVADPGVAVATGVRDVSTSAPGPAPGPAGMAWVPPGRFAMGSDFEAFGDARPIHAVDLDGFWMDRTPVTNDEFARFVRETRYVTVAERAPDPKDFPGVPRADLVAGSLVFTPPAAAVALDDVSGWWRYVAGASWRHPEGPGSDLDGRGEHPAVQVCWDDAAAYARWAGKRLPTEAEWEYAARGGLDRQPYAWGGEFRPGGKIMANTWQGRFPDRNTAEDGWARTSPVGRFPPNGFGLLDMAGNVWQWCADWYRPDAYALGPAANPAGPPDGLDPQEPGVRKRVQRGGSFLCSDQYCSRYRPGGRGKGAVDTGSSHVGFRCVLSPAVPPEK